MKKLLLIFSIFVAFDGVRGQTPVKIMDMGANIDDVAYLGETLFFAGDEGLRGTELWKTDGTEAGTVQVKDIWEGGNNTSSNPYNFFTYKNEVYFLARKTGGNTYRLYKTDGTSDGTKQLTDQFLPGLQGIKGYFIFKDKLYFYTEEGFRDALWVTDGTEQGTKRVTRFLSYVNSSVILSDKIYFSLSGSDFTGIVECDGASTKEVKAFSNLYGNMVVMNNHLYFAGDDGTYGNEVWKSDGTGASTVLLSDIAPKRASSNPDQFVANSKKVVFTIYDNGRYVLWETDGTEAGTKKLVDAKGRDLARVTPRPVLWTFSDRIYTPSLLAIRDNVYIDEFNIYVYGPNDSFVKPFYLGGGGAFSDFRFYQGNLYYSTGGFFIDLSKVNPATDSSVVMSKFNTVSLGTIVRGWQLVSNGVVFSTGTTYEGGYRGLYKVSFCAHTAKINAPDGTTLCPGESVAISAEGVGGTGGYTYKWSSGSTDLGTGAKLTVTKGGLYTVDVVNAGCTVSSFVEIKESTTVLTPTITTTTTSLTAGATAVLATAEVPGRTYQWNRNGQSIAGATKSAYTTGEAGEYTVSVRQEGCSATSPIVRLEMILAIEPGPSPHGLVVWPNPVQQSIEVRFTSPKASPATFSLVDSDGRVVGEWQSTQPRKIHTLTLPMKTPPSGVYFLRAEVDGQQTIRRVFKQ
jgi:ELWxxDGT repeat protein